MQGEPFAPLLKGHVKKGCAGFFIVGGNVESGCARFVKS